VWWVTNTEFVHAMWRSSDAAGGCGRELTVASPKRRKWTFDGRPYLEDRAGVVGLPWRDAAAGAGVVHTTGVPPAVGPMCRPTAGEVCFAAAAGTPPNDLHPGGAHNVGRAERRQTHRLPDRCDTAGPAGRARPAASRLAGRRSQFATPATITPAIPPPYPDVANAPLPLAYAHVGRPMTQRDAGASGPDDRKRLSHLPDLRLAARRSLRRYTSPVARRARDRRSNSASCGTQPRRRLLDGPRRQPRRLPNPPPHTREG
jgi:hypothetical protein